MRTFLLLILGIIISCHHSALMSKEERLNRQKAKKEKFIKCLKENASKSFIEFIDKNESNLRFAISKNKNNIAQEDLLVVRSCKQKLFWQNK